MSEVVSVPRRAVVGDVAVVRGPGVCWLGGVLGKGGRLRPEIERLMMRDQVPEALRAEVRQVCASLAFAGAIFTGAEFRISGTTGASVADASATSENELTAQQAAHILGFSDRHVRGLCDRGRIPGAVRDRRGHWWLPRHSVEAFNRRRQAA
jgi:Helix-turn-helix domain